MGFRKKKETAPLDTQTDRKHEWHYLKKTLHRWVYINVNDLEFRIKLISLLDTEIINQLCQLCCIVISKEVLYRIITRKKTFLLDRIKLSFVNTNIRLIKLN